MTFDVANGAIAQLAAARPIAGPQLVPYKPYAEILAEGQVRVRPHPLLVALAVARGSEILVQKRLVVRSSTGERDTDIGALAPDECLDADDPRVFARLAAAASRQPAVQDELGDRVLDAGDLRSLQSAPRDQWFRALAGGERVRCVGLAAGPIDTFLPALTVKATVATGGRNRVVPMLGDTIIAHADEMQVSVLFRGGIERPRGDGTELEARAALVPTDPPFHVGVPAAWRPPKRQAPSPAVDRLELVDRCGLPTCTTRWSFQPKKMRRVVIIKATLAIGADGRSLDLATEQEPLSADVFDTGANAAEPALQRASDFAPYKRQADVLLHAARPASGPVALDVASVSVREPNSLGLSPVSPRAPARASLLGTFDDAWLRDRWPFMPADFDPGYFQAAPPPMRTSEIRPGARIRAHGILSEEGTIDAALPDVRPRAILLSASAPPLDVPLTLDTLTIDGEARRVHLVWRGSFPFAPRERGAERLVLLRDSVERPLGPREVEALGVVSATREWEDRVVCSHADLERAMPVEAMARRWASLESSRRNAPAASPISSPMSEPIGVAELRAAIAAGESLRDRDLSHAALDGADLAGLDLRGVVLRGASLRGAKLDGARLSGANFVRARAQDASFDRADLSTADLSGARLERATFREAKLDRASFAKADLVETTWQAAVGLGVSFVEATLDRAVLDGVKWLRANFTRAKARGVSFRGAELCEATFQETEADGAIFDGAVLSDARFELADCARASFRAASAQASTWEGVNASGANLEGALLPSSVWSGASLAGAKASRIRAAGALFREADLSGAELVRAELSDASFEDAILDRADFADAVLRGASFIGADTAQARFAGADLTGVKPSRK